MLGLSSFFRRRDTAKHFIELVKQSGLVTDAERAHFCADLNQRTPKHVQELAGLFVEAELLNQWQADHLLKGKYKGFLLGEYRLQDFLRNGSMSTVFLARQSGIERLVMVKVLPKRFSGDKTHVARFRREATTTAALVHPNIIRTYELGEYDNRLYMVMEYVGPDLQKIVDGDGPLTAADAADYIAQAAMGLQQCHDAGMIHRDVKPANLLLDEQHQIKLFDMGLARFPGTDSDACEFLDDAVVDVVSLFVLFPVVRRRWDDH